MNCLLKITDRYIQESDWKIMALLKTCLCAMGILIGCNVPKKYRKPVVAGSAAVFFLTYIPLMRKFVEIAVEEGCLGCEIETIEDLEDI